jgi:hypothetical protein
MENTKFTTTELKVLKALVLNEIKNSNKDLEYKAKMPILAAMLQVQLNGLENILEKLNSIENAL